MVSTHVQAPSKELDVYLLPLNDDGSPNIGGSYVYLPPPTEPEYVLRFSIQGTSSICQRGRLWINIPREGCEFIPDKFQHFELNPDFNRAIYIDIPIRHPGAFTYYFTYSPLPGFSIEPTETVSESRTEDFFIDVAPRLTLNGRYLPLDSLTIISSLSKLMGKCPSEWKKHFRGISARGYNCVHFTPLNRRGESNSPYSIYDQLQFDPTAFPNGEKDVARLVKEMEQDWGLLSLCDVVWNHTANNSPWLHDHPDSGYNILTSPHLEAALELDTALLHYSQCLRSYGKPTEVKTTNDLLVIMDGIKSHCISGLKLWEFYVCNKDTGADSLISAWKNSSLDELESSLENSCQLILLKDASLQTRATWFVENGVTGAGCMGGRFHRKVDPSMGAFLLHLLFGPYSEDCFSQAHEEISKLLDEINLHFYREYDDDVAQILEQLFNRIKYMRLDEHGPKLGPINTKNPLVESYFTRLTPNNKSNGVDPRRLALVNNGWVWAADAMKDHAGPQSKAYLRREVIVWGDCVKLRYGRGPEDNPYLWDRMSKYTHLMAKYFHAFRIDNCHSTPIHVAAYLLNEARRTRPNLAVFAELFSGSEEMDFLFVKRLNLNGLIREAMQSWNAQEMSRLVHRQSGRPIGSFEIDYIRSSHSSHDTVHSCPPHEAVRHIRSSPLHPLFMDCTHDNETPAQKRDARDTLPNSALVAMCACSIGSVMGYDEIYPELINLVTETRSYVSPYSNLPEGQDISTIDAGIGSCKAIFNKIHKKMAEDGYIESFVHHEQEFITIHRVQPHTREGFFCVVHTAYSGCHSGRGNFGQIELPGNQAELIGSWTLEVDQSEEAKTKLQQDPNYLNGLPSKVTVLEDIRIKDTGNGSIICLPANFGPGSVAVFKTCLPAVSNAVKAVCPSSDLEVDAFVVSDAAEAFDSMSMVDLNLFLYRCDAEERDFSGGQDGAYNIPGYGPLVYCGIQGWWSVLEEVIRKNDLGHAICNHLREGDWPMDYILSRLEKFVQNHGFQSLSKPLEWLKTRFMVVKKLPKFLHPRYFAMVIRTAYHAAVDRNLSLLPPAMNEAHGFVKQLALVSTQMTGITSNASLWPSKVVPSMSAGLPHFSTDWARCWGRDIFISIRGLYLYGGRFDLAREHIFAFASVVKHGMIPNLLSAGRLPRYNSRDSVWFFLHAIQEYCRLSPEGTDVLQAKIPRRFLPYDDTWFSHEDPRAYSQNSTLEDVIFEIVQRHATGLHFREHNAGPELDRQMTDPGFNIDNEVDWDTGLLFGGNQFNCGTWMDKMGESEKAGSKGVPGTPRDGAAVEINGLLYSTLAWLRDLSAKKLFSYDCVKKADETEISFSAWADLIKTNFERCFFIPISPEDDKDYDVDSSLINRRGIYKDLYRSGKPYEDYQLRPNFQIAMVVAPELFTLKNALHALYVADKILRGPLGMATLDPSDHNYRPFYNNSEDSDDFATSKGRNYHQGPEWVWPLGFHLRAILRFVLQAVDEHAERDGWSLELRQAKRIETFQHLHRRLQGCRNSIASADNPWKGLTELTQKGGAYCCDSSPTQAWSAACLLDLFADGREMEVLEHKLHG